MWYTWGRKRRGSVWRVWAQGPQCCNTRPSLKGWERSWAVSVPHHLQQKSQGWSFREEKQILSLNRPQRIKEVKKQTFCTSQNRSNFCRDDCCLRHQQGSGRGGWMNIARRRGCAALPWESFGVPFITKGFFHRKIRVWRELCSIPEHVPGWPASLETAVATALAKPRRWPAMGERATWALVPHAQSVLSLLMRRHS